MTTGLPPTAGRCRHCGRPFTSGEVTGLGILRPRRLEDGGPRVEFTCPACRTVNPLVPHGGGRFAPPGAPPPPPPSDGERRVPWQRPTGDAAAGDATTREAPPRPAPPTPPPPRPPPAAAPSPAVDVPTTVAEALEVLGVPPQASLADIERAYRAQALKLHPDKVAHLDADFVALAERKFRRLQAARDLLVGP